MNKILKLFLVVILITLNGEGKIGHCGIDFYLYEKRRYALFLPITRCYYIIPKIA
jgi:hypothetical protein